MSRDDSRPYIPQEVEDWFRKDLIDSSQRDSIKERFETDVWDAIEYFYQTGLIDEHQYQRLHRRYIPAEIDRWFREGIISYSQYLKLRKGYSGNIEEVIEELERSGEIDLEQSDRLKSSYGIELTIYPIPEEAPYQPEIDYEEFDIPEVSPPIMEESMNREIWPYEYEIKEEEFLSTEPERKIEKPPERTILKKVGRELVRTPVPSKVEKHTETKHEKKGEVERESFFKFNQLLFFITGAVLFLLAVFATIAYFWDQMNNLGRGITFLGISTLVLFSGLSMKYRDFNRYFEVITYHASFILFGVGTIFLMSGSLGKENIEHGVVILSLMIPLMVVIVSYHFRYYSMAIVGGIGYIVALGNSYYTWPDGSMGVNLVLLIISVVLLGLIRDALPGIKRSLSFTRRYRSDDPTDSVFVLSLLSVSAISFLISQSILVLEFGRGSTASMILSGSGVFLLLFLYFIFNQLELHPLRLTLFLFLVSDSLLQFGLLNDMGLNTLAISGLIFTIPFYLFYFISSIPDDERIGSTVSRVIVWISGLGTCILLLIPEPLYGLDPISQISLFLAVFSMISLFLSRLKRNDPVYISSLVLLMLVSSFYSLAKMDIAAFISLLAPLIFILYFRKTDPYPEFEFLFLTLVTINYLILWMGPLFPYSYAESLIDPIFDWWKGSLTLLFSIILVYWGLLERKEIRFWIGSFMFLFSTWMAMQGQGDLFILLFFILTSAPVVTKLLKSGDGTLSGKSEEFFNYFMLFAGVVLFISMWFTPVFSPVKDSGMGWSWWKSSVALLFSFIYILWGVVSLKRFHFLVGSICFSTVVTFNTYYRSELFALLLIFLPVMYHFLQVSRRTRKEISLQSDMVYLGLLSAKFSGIIFAIYLITPYDPLFDFDYSSVESIIWIKSAVAALLALSILFWGILKRSKYYLFLGTALISMISIIQAVNYSELFLIVPCLIPPVVFLKERMNGELRKSRSLRSYMKRMSYFPHLLVTGLSMKSGKKPVPLPSHWLLRYSFPAFLIPLSFSLLFVPRYPLMEIVLDRHYHNFLVLSIMTLPYFIQAGRSRQILPIAISTILISLGILFISITKVSFFNFSLLILPLILVMIQRIDPGKMQKRFVNGFMSFFTIILLSGFILIWFKPIYPEIDLDLLSSANMLYKGSIAVVFGSIILSWGYIQKLKTTLTAGSVMVSISILFLSVVFMEPLVFIFSAVPIIIIWLSRTGGPLRHEGGFGNFIERYLPFSNIWFVLAYLTLFLPQVHPVFDVGQYTRSFWFYKGGLAFVYSVVILSYGILLEKNLLITIIGTYLTSASILILSIVLAPELILLLIPLLVLTARGMERLSGKEAYGTSEKLAPILSTLYLLAGFSVPFIPTVFPFVEYQPFEQFFWSYRYLLLLLFSGSILAYGLFKSRDPVSTTLGIIFSTLTILLISFTLLSEAVFLLFLLLILVDLKKEAIGWNEEDKGKYKGIYSLLIVPFIIGFIVMWFLPVLSYYQLDLASTSFWIVKFLTSMIFASFFYMWGLWKRELHIVIISSILATISILIFGFTTLSIVLLAVFIVPYMLEIYRKRRETLPYADENSDPITLFQNLYLIVSFSAFILLWIPELMPVIHIELWSTGYFLFRGSLALIFTGIMMGCCVAGDRPYHLIFSNLFILATSFILVITVSEIFALLVYLIPLSLLISEYKMYRYGFRKASRDIYKYFQRALGREPDVGVREPSLFEDFEHIFLTVSVAFFVLLFIMIWNRPWRMLFDLDDNGHLWFISVTMFVYAAIPIFWGIKEILRAHVLVGVVFIVVNGWVMFLSQMQGLGAVISLFFTAVMFIMGGIYFVWASKRQKITASL